MAAALIVEAWDHNLAKHKVALSNWGLDMALRLTLASPLVWA